MNNRTTHNTPGGYPDVTPPNQRNDSGGAPIPKTGNPVPCPPPRPKPKGK